jgi:hypothetical protein
MSIHVWTCFIHVYTCMYMVHTCIYIWLFVGRVGDGTVLLAIVLYIDGSFVKHKIPVRPIYITVRCLARLRVLGMMPNVHKSATLAQSDQWRKERRLRLHHACIAHVVDMVNRSCGEDKHILCADGQVHTRCIHVYSKYVHCMSMYTQ